jgi:hypothetical protein
MSVGAIKVDTLSTSGPHAAGATTRASGSADFASILSSLRNWGDADTDAQLATPTTTMGHSITRTEVARTVAVFGHLRLTTIRFSDGSSDVQVNAIDSDISQIPFSPFPGDHRPQRVGIRALSDLEPEVGLDSASEEGEFRPAWKHRPAGTPGARRRGSATGRSDPPPSELQVRIQALDESDVGTLVDILS